jgi:hypothetical protein
MAAPQATPVRAALGRVTWMFFGPMLLVVTAAAIAMRGSGFFSFADLFYFLVLGAMLAGRWVEFRGGDPQTATGEPASPQHLRRYLLAASLVGLAVWGTARLSRAFWLNG